MSTDSQDHKDLEKDAQKILPIYIAVDHSWSMDKTENDAIDAANALIPSVIDTCLKNPLADQRARFSIIGFNDQAEVVAPLARGTNLAHHHFTAESGTSYTEVFKLLRDRLESDYVSLAADDYEVFRPAVFLITDGEPMCDDDERAKAFAALTEKSFKRRPNISVFGVGQNVSPDVLKEYKSGVGRAFVTKDGVTAAESLSGFIDHLMSSIVNSTGNVMSDDEDGFEWDETGDEEFMLEIES